MSDQESAGASSSGLQNPNKKTENGSKDYPEWIYNLKEHFDFVKMEPREVAERPGKTRMTYTLSCTLCQIGSSCKSGKSTKRGPRPSHQCELTGNNVTTFRRHLQRCHKDNHNTQVYAAVNRKSKGSKRSASDSDEDDSIVPDVIGGGSAVANFRRRSEPQKYAETGIKQREFNEVVLNGIVEDGAPFCTVEKRGFQNTIAYLDGKYNVPSRRTLMRMLQEKHDKITGHLEETLKGLKQKSAHLILDIWSSRQRLAVIGVQVRYSKKWKIIQQTVGFAEFPGSHDANSIKQKLDSILSKYGLTMADFLTVTADNASSILGAFKDTAAPTLISSRTALQHDSIFSEQRIVQPGESSRLCSTEILDVESDEELPDLDGEQREDIISEFVVESQIEDAIDAVIYGLSQVTCEGMPVIIRRNSCLAHLLQLGIRDALEHTTVAKIMKKVNSIITWFHKSNKQYTTFRERTGLGLIRPCETRWNATYMCLQRLMTMCKTTNLAETDDDAESGQRSLVSFANRILLDAKRNDKRSKAPQPINVEEISLMGGMLQLLKPLADLTDMWQGDGITSSSVIVGIVDALTAVKLIDVDADDELSVFKTNLLELVQQRFDTNRESGQKPARDDQASRKIVTIDVLNDKYYILATLLDPRLKTAPFEDNFEGDLKFRNNYPSKETVVDILKKAYEWENDQIAATQDVVVIATSSQVSFVGSQSSNEPFQSVNNEAVGEVRDKTKQRRDIFSRVQEHRASQANKEKNLDEIDQYLGTPPISSKDCPLKYWRQSAQMFPVLSSLAGKLLAMPATSASVERLFSVSGAIISNRRCSLKIGTVEKMILYKEYLRQGISLS